MLITWCVVADELVWSSSRVDVGSLRSTELVAKIGHALGTERWRRDIDWLLSVGMLIGSPGSGRWLTALRWDAGWHAGRRNTSLDRDGLISGVTTFLHRKPPSGGYRLWPLNKQVSVLVSLFFFPLTNIWPRVLILLYKGQLYAGFAWWPILVGREEVPLRDRPLELSGIGCTKECLGTGLGRRVRELLLLTWRWREGTSVVMWPGPKHIPYHQPCMMSEASCTTRFRANISVHWWVQMFISVAVSANLLIFFFSTCWPSDTRYHLWEAHIIVCRPTSWSSDHCREAAFFCF